MSRWNSAEVRLERPRRPLLGPHGNGPEEATEYAMEQHYIGKPLDGPGLEAQSSATHRSSMLRDATLPLY